MRRASLIRLRRRKSNLILSVAVISNLTASDQGANGEVSVTYTISGPSVVTGVVTTSASAPTAAQILAGQDHLGAAASSTFVDTWSAVGSDSLEDIASGLTTNTYYLHVLPSGGGDLSVASSNGFTLETVAPTVNSAATSTDGLTVNLAASEAVTGTASDLDWEVFSNGSPLGVDSVSPINSTSSIALTLVTAATAGSTLTFNYTPGDIKDAVSNPLPAITGQSVTNNVPVSGDPVEFAAVLEHVNVNEDPQLYTVNLGTLGYQDGDLILIGSGVQRQGIVGTTGLTVNGAAATLIVDGGGTAGSRMSSWYYIVDETENSDISTGDITISVDLSTAENDGLLLLLNAGGYRLAGTTQGTHWQHGNNDSGGTISNTVSTATSQEIVVTMVMGQGGNFSGVTATTPPTYALGVEKENQTGIDLGSNKGISFNLYEPGAAGTQAQTITGNGVDKFAATTVVLG